MNIKKHSDNSSTTEYYNRNARVYYAQTVNLDISNRYNQFLKLIPPNGKILDAGCGSGRDSLCFKQQGYDVVSFDISKELVDLASQLIGQKVLNISFNQLNFENEFDGIWASASLLHVPQEEMEDVLGKLSRALKKNGVLYASFKYGDKERTNGDRFFNDYNEDKLKLLINRHKNLKIENIWITEDVRADRKNESWMNVLFVLQGDISMAKKKLELILEVGAAGGSLSVLSSTNKDGRRSFFVKRDESTLKELMDEKDAEGIKFTSTTGQLQSFADALTVLGQYPWHRLYPMFVHHDFIDPVLAAVMTLGGQKELDRWKQRIKYE